MDENDECGSGRWNHDLFVSFFGQDVRTTFLENLYTALDETRICRIYRDNVNLKRTNDISPNLLKAIKESRISIIAFSAHYAESEWCLEELVQILKCRETDDQKVLPLFYDVNTQHVHQLTATYAHAFAKHKEKHDKDKVDAWRDAVQKAAAIAGIDRNKGSEKAFILNIVEHVVAFIKRKLLAIDQPLVDSSSHVAKVRLLLGMGINDARMIVIWGDEGMGKTTIAKLVYNDILSEFNYFCFLHNVGDRHKSQEDSNGVLTTLQNEILSSLSVVRSYGMAEGTSETKVFITTTCSTKKVLFVIDGVDDLAQIEALGAYHYKLFGKGSRIIVTTRHRDLFDKLAVRHDDHRQYYYQAMGWKPKESLELFCRHAFGKAEPPNDNDYYKHSNDCLQLAGGVPLALKKLGSYLNGKTKQEWKGSLDKFRKAPKGTILRDLYDIHNDNGQRSNYKTQNMVTWLWGGEDGEEWTYQPKGKICKIRITFDQNAICSIGFTSKGENDHVEASRQFGGTDGKETCEIDTYFRNENQKYGIRGTIDTYNGMQIVTSLSFTTNNNRTFGPFGTEVGASFSMTGDVHQTIVGFHGRSSRWLNAIGVILRPIPKPTSAAGLLQPSISKLISAGSWGSQAPGNKWTYVPKGSISDIFITYDNAIRSIRAIRSISFISKDENNNEDCSKRFGNRMGAKDAKISIDTKYEKLNKISGTFDLESGYDVVTSLSFCTDTGKSFGPFGSARGMSFSLMVKDHGFIGFHGRSSDRLDAIGVYLQPTTNIRIGRWGCQNLGNDWDYLPSGAIYKIVITHDDIIHSIGFLSRDHKGIVFGKVWTPGSRSDEVNIDTKYEKLNYISGTYGKRGANDVITSLTFCTDKGTQFGPFGSARGASFSLPLNNGFISGFFGCSEYWLDAIGVYVNPN